MDCEQEHQSHEQNAKDLALTLTRIALQEHRSISASDCEHLYEESVLDGRALRKAIQDLLRDTRRQGELAAMKGASARKFISHLHDCEDHWEISVRAYQIAVRSLLVLFRVLPSHRRRHSDEWYTHLSNASVYPATIYHLEDILGWIEAKKCPAKNLQIR